MDSSNSQIPLSVSIETPISFDSFYAGNSNAIVLEALRKQALSQGDWFVYLHGSKGVGKSHLLAASYSLALDSGFASVCLPLDQLVQYAPEDVLQGLPALDFICLDNINCVLERRNWCEALFALFNELHANGGRLLVAADMPAASLSCDLADLQSRLSWAANFAVKPLNEVEQMALLQHRAQNLGLTLSEDSANFIITRSERSTASLLRIIDELDRASLREKRALTIPFLKSVFNW